MNKNFSATITDLTHDGRGVTHIDGKATFVEDALPGEEVTFSYLRRRSQHDDAKALEILKSSRERITPECPHFGICGGCSLQHLQSEAQIKYKQKILLNQLHHFGSIVPANILEPITGPIFGYRRKARLSVKYVRKKSKVLIGFHERDGRYVADLKSCAILDPRIGTKLTALAELVSSLSIYDQIPQIEIAGTDATLALVFRHLMPLTAEDLTKLQDFANQHSFEVYLQPKGPDSAKPLSLEAKTLSYKLDANNLELFFTPTDFIQINATINKKLISRVIELLEPKPSETILDLFCGLGNFTLPLARIAGRVIGVEGNEDLIKRAKENALHNNLCNVEFYQANLVDEKQLAPWSKMQFDKILLDPPRTGALEIVKQISSFNAKKIVYVSCNPATLARDCKELEKNGYKLKQVGLLDMFPHTTHIETIAVLELI